MKTAILVLLIVLSAATLWAETRTWTARVGEFTVEAELVDVRQGKAVLRKADGSELSVSLDQLSLSDLRYINAELAAARAAVGEETLQPMAADSTEDAAEASQAPPDSPPADAGEKTPKSPYARALLDGLGKDSAAASKRADVGPFSPLRYGWQKDRSYTYNISIEATIGDRTSEHRGSITYSVERLGQGEAELNVYDTISELERFEPSRFPTRPYYGLPSLPRLRSASPWSPSSAKLTVDALGGVRQLVRTSPLPYLLGDSCQLVLEPLSPDGEQRWTVKTQTGIAIDSTDDRFPMGVPRFFEDDSRGERLAADEQTTYAIQATEGSRVTLSKRYEMKTAVAIDGKPRYHMTGDGSVVFDTAEAMPVDSEMEYRLAMRNSNITIEFPVKVKYHMLSQAEEKKIAADAEKARIERERPLNQDEIAALVKDLDSGDASKANSAAAKLAQKPPTTANRAVARALEQALASGTDTLARASAARALQSWGTLESVPALIKALDGDSLVSSPAAEALGKLKAKTAIEPLARALKQNSYSAAVEALKAIGPEVEPTVLKLLSDGESEVRQRACQVLEAVGTPKSLPALRKVAASSDALAKMYAESAVRSIESRH